MKKFAPLLVLAIAAALSSCKKEEAPVAEDFGYDYFPDKVGTWVEYQVDSLWYDEGFANDSVSYRLKRVIAAHYTDPEGRPAMRIEQFKLVEDEWVIRDVWSAVRTSSALEITEENVRKLKLSFPLREGRTWDMNIYNPDLELLVAARDLGSSRSLNGMNFPRIVAIRSTVPGNLIESRDLDERYAYGVGMIEHHWSWTRRDTPGGPVKLRVKYDMEVVGYGVQ